MSFEVVSFDQKSCFFQEEEIAPMNDFILTGFFSDEKDFRKRNNLSIRVTDVGTGLSDDSDTNAEQGNKRLFLFDSDDDQAGVHNTITTSSHAQKSNKKRKSKERYFGSTDGRLVGIRPEHDYQGVCWLCAQGIHAASDCPNQRCFNCLQAGHQSKDCKQRKGAIT